MEHEDVVPCIVPNYDHIQEAKEQVCFCINRPQRFWETLLKGIKRILDSKETKNSSLRYYYVLCKWNEWAEGNYLEPDCVFGRSYLERIKRFWLMDIVICVAYKNCFFLKKKHSVYK